MTNNAIEMAGFNHDIIDRIWVKRRQPFEVF